MGNKLGRIRKRELVVDERYTRPQGLYVNKDVDIQKLKRLIIDSKLAPCYPGADEFCRDLEECPICFLHYPSLNRSRCCMKSICTECFLQIKRPNSTRPTQCPFCKTPNYAVEFRGVKTKEEKGMEQIEEQRVIEAKIRIRQKEMLDDKERIQKLQESSCSSSTNTVAADVDNGQAAGQNIGFRDEEFDSDLEDIMVMEAIWLSIQEMSRCEDVVYSDSPGYASEDRYISASSRPISGPLTSSSPSPTSSPLWSLLQSSPSSSTSAFAETSCSNGETSNGGDGSSFNMFLGNSTGYYNLVETNDYPSVHTSCCSSSYDAAEDNSGGISMWKQCEGGVLRTFQGFLPPICPESFEEQMMLAMSGSLAEVHATTSGVVWQ